MPITPEWFLSTLAQSMAVVVEFNITLVTLLISLKFNRKQRRSDEYKEETHNFKNKCGSVLDTPTLNLK